MQIQESRLRQIVREELFGFGKKKRSTDVTAVKAALDAFMKSLAAAYGGDPDVVDRPMANLRSRLEPMLQDITKYLAAKE